MDSDSKFVESETKSEDSIKDDQPANVRRKTDRILTRRKSHRYGYFSLYRYSTSGEMSCMLIGFIFALVAGGSMPMLVYEFGKLSNVMILIEIIGGFRADFDEGRSTATANETYYKIYSAHPPFCMENQASSDVLAFLTNPNVRNDILTRHMNTFVVNHTIWGGILFLSSAVYFFIWFLCGENLIDRLSMAYFEAMLRKDTKWMDTRKDPEQIVNSIIEYTQTVREGIGERVAILFYLVFVAIGSLIMAFSNGWALSLVSLVSIPLLILTTSFVSSLEASQVAEENKAYSIAGSLAAQVFLNIRTVMVYGGQKKEFAMFDSALNQSENKLIRRTLYASLANGLVWFFTYATYGLSFWYGSKLLLQDRDNCDPDQQEQAYAPGKLIMIFFGVMFGAANIGLGFPVLESMINIKAKEIFQIIDTSCEMDSLSTEGVIPELPLQGKIIKLSEVFFRYPARPNVQVLKNISLKVKEFSMVALVGTSGSGKSTILKLLTKEYLANSGYVKLYGTDIRALNTSWLRSQIGVVTEESKLFDGTIEQNILMGNPAANAEDVESTCKIINAHDFISRLEKGYQTQVGSEGTRLSSGQRQLICIARALIRNPRILLLDEPTSSLDNQSEAIVQEGIQKAGKNRTTFIVAHRLNTIVNADVIFVFDHGEIIERGTHSELLGKKGLYFKLATGQFDTKPSMQGNRNKLMDNQLNTVLNSEQRSTIKTLDKIVKSPFRSPLAYNLSDKVTRRVTTTMKIKRRQSIEGLESMYSIHKVEEYEDNEIEKIHPAHTQEENQKEKQLWEKYMKKLESQGQSSEVPPMNQKEKFEFWPVIRMVTYYPFLIVLGVIASIGMGFTLPIYGVFFGLIFEQLTVRNIDEAIEETSKLSFYFVVTGACAFVVVFIHHFTLTFGGSKAVNRVRKRLFFSILRQDIGWFDRPENGVPQLNTRLGTEAGSVQYIVISLFGVLVACLSTLIVVISYSMLFSWQMTLMCLGLIPILIGAGVLDGFLSKIHEEKTSVVIDQLSKIVYQVFQNRQVVLTCQLEKYFIDKYKLILSTSTKSTLGLAIARSLAFGLAQSVVFLTYSLCMYLASIELKRKGSQTEYHDVLAVSDGLMFALMTMGDSLNIVPSFTRALYAGNKILRILRNQPKFDFDTDGLKLESTKGLIEFKDVKFWYPNLPDAPILKGISFSIQPGQMVALVGSSGSGKSMCINLILRFEDITQGSLTLDGIEIKDLNCASLTSFMALVEQEPKLFDRTIEENIGYGDNTRIVREDEVIAAAKAANIHYFIASLPEGYQTRVGSSGSLLSGGQKQRIAIARALVRNPQILILDEATSSLDRENEKIVQESLEIARRGRSCLAVAHRLSSIAQADLIVVLHQGNIVEFGTHSSLLESRGLYYLLWMAQNPMLNAKFTGVSGGGGKDDVDVIHQLAEFSNSQ